MDGEWREQFDLVLSRLKEGGVGLELIADRPHPDIDLPAQFRRGEYVTFIEDWIESSAQPGRMYQLGQYPAPNKVSGLVAGRIESTQVAAYNDEIKGRTLFRYYRRYSIHIDAFADEAGNWKPFGNRRDGYDSVMPEVHLLMRNPRLLPYGQEAFYDGVAAFPKIGATLERYHEMLVKVDAAIYTQVALGNLNVFKRWTNISGSHLDMLYRLFADGDGNLDFEKMARLMHSDKPDVRAFRLFEASGEWEEFGKDILDLLFPPWHGNHRSSVEAFEGSGDSPDGNEPKIDLSWLDTSSLETGSDDDESA